MNIPTERECEEIIQHFNVPEKVIKHVNFVWTISSFIAEKLIKKGIKINLPLLKTATYLHDIDKIQTLENGQHGIVAYDYLKNKYPEVAEIIISHVKNLVKYYPLNTWEKKILFYCDKITQDDEIVLFENRIDYLRRRDGKISDKKIASIKDAMGIVKDTEKEIFNELDITPHDLKEIFK